MMQDSPELRQAIQLEKFGQLCRTLPQSIGFGVILQLVCVAVLWSSQQTTLLLSWLAAHSALSAWRLIGMRRYQRLQRSDPDAALRMVPFIRVGCLASGLMWGLLSMVAYPQDDARIPLFVTFVSAGVTAAGCMAMVSDLICALSFQLAVFAVMVIRLVGIEEGSIYLGMGLTALLYTVFMVAWTIRINRNAINDIRRRLDAARREQQLQQREARYRELAHHDALTGLPNRLALQAQLPELLAKAAAQDSGAAVIYLDLDHFKDINDSRGHRCGDHLLATVSARLRECVGPDDLVVRMGGDEFIVATLDLRRPDSVELLARRLAACIEAPVTHEDDLLQSSASMGIALFPEHGSEGDTLLQHADIALYQAKAEGRRNHKLYTRHMSVVFSERIFLEKALMRALASDQLFVEYQPLVDLGTGRLSGFEALLRWRHPERGLVPPLNFIPIAEHCGLIDALGELVLRQICRQMRRWQADGAALLPVALNVSPRQFEGGRLGELLLAVCTEHQIPPTLLQIEITETALMKEGREAAHTLAMLRNLGATVMIDDFGTGFSSLNQLKRLSIDGLKIDRSFVRDMLADERDAAIVSAVIGIGASLGVSVLAEGVESNLQAQRLRALGCQFAQGNFLHPPASGEHCLGLLQQAGRGELLWQAQPQSMRAGTVSLT